MKRERGSGSSSRANGSQRPSSSRPIGPMRPLSTTQEVTVNTDQVKQLQQMYETHPTIVAAKNVLESQLLGGGLQLKLDGEASGQWPELSQHIDECWMPFARDLISAFLVYGYAVVAYEKEDLLCPTVRARVRRRVDGVINGKLAGRMNGSDDSDRVGDERDGGRGTMRTSGKSSQKNGATIIPMVVSPSNYTLCFTNPEGSYQRRYYIYRTTRVGGMDEDISSALIVHDPPDDLGNINSPMASVRTTIQFIETLTDAAVEAEVNRANPMLVTEQQQRDGREGVQAIDMFFDTESQNIARTQTVEDNETQARLLRMQLEYCRVVNGSAPSGSVSNPSRPSPSSVGASSTEAIRRNVEMGARLFALPSHQRVASSVPIPQVRPDLQQLYRLSIEFICAAMGVPSSLIFEGRFASRSSAQLSLLNSTVQRLSKMLDSTLTSAYLEVHGNEDVSRRVELTTVVSPLASCEEVLALYQGGLADFQVAAPLALNAVGASTSEISMAMERHEKNSELQSSTVPEDTKDVNASDDQTADKDTSAGSSSKRSSANGTMSNGSKDAANLMQQLLVMQQQLSEYTSQ